MSALKDKYQSVGQFFKDVKRTVEDIVTRLSDVETRIDESVGGGLMQEEEDGKEYKAGEGILITDDDSVVLNYNGPFAYHLDHIDTTTATTLWVTRSIGYVVRNGLRRTVYANTTPAAMASGESAWMLYNTDADSYSISIQTNAPTATSNKICVKLAENVNGVLRQIQFGELVIMETSGSTAVIGFPDYGSVVLDINSDYLHTFPYNEEYTYPVWIIGNAHFAPSQDIQELKLTIYPSTSSTPAVFSMADCDYGSDWNTADNRFSSHFNLSIPANTPFRIEIPEGCIEPSAYRYRVFKCLS